MGSDSKVSVGAARGAALLLLAALALAVPAAASGAAPAFTELTGTSGCLVTLELDAEDETCARVGGLSFARGVTVSPDDRYVYVASGGGLQAGSNGVATFRRDATTGALEPAGCVSAGGGDGRPGSEGACALGDALLGAGDVAITSDGKRAYVASTGSNGVAYLDRDPATGALTPAGCVKDVKRQDRCDQAPPLVGAAEVAISPDDTDVYVAATLDGAVHAFRRDAQTGELASNGCVSETGSDGLCEPVPGLRNVRDLVMSPAGDAVYAAGTDGVVASFTRDGDTGALAPAGCLLADAPAKGPCKSAPGLTGASDAAVSPDGRDVYVAGGVETGTVASFRRGAGAGAALAETGCLQYVAPPEPEDEDEDGGDGEDEDAAESQDEGGPEPGCTAVTGSADSFTSIVVSADGATVFAAGGSYVAMYRRDKDTGTLTPAGCAGPEGLGDGDCAGVGFLDRFYADAIAATSDGRNLYVTAAAGGVKVLGAAVTVTASSLRSRRGGRVAVPLACPRVRARSCAGRVALTGTRSKQFRLRPGGRAKVALRLGPNARRTLAWRGGLRLTARASDFAHVVRPGRWRVTVRRGR